jgi:hypothetical protein
MLCCVLCCLQLLLAFSRDISRLRARYISMLPRGTTSHTVLVTDIPCLDGMGSTPPKKGPLDRLTGLINRKGDPDAIHYDDTKVSNSATAAAAAAVVIRCCSQSCC